MSYQVLARKWRPRFFDEMVGQEHVLRALINALNEGRLHHAYLFTGTRGVGKTTIARILAKCLNCEQGVSARPCGECTSCREIAEGRFVDLIEVDAASRTRVEDTRELLDNVQYAPTRGRFKVYLIDEVHMLSTHSFNALLKTLEEPPEHVKFLLATTDPQKLPVTILSRCLQFSLKNMTPERIVGYLGKVLEAESVPFEEPALWSLGRAAQGSMRDALSLTDQAIAFGEGEVHESQVNAMLGTMDRGRLFRLAEVMAKGDAATILQETAEMAEHSPDFDEILQGLLHIWHRASLAQLVPDAIENAEGDREAILQLSMAMPAEDLQLYYQIALQGRKDLALAPDPRQGFEMVLLRMLAFRPAPDVVPELDLASALEKKKPLTSAEPASEVLSTANVVADSHTANDPASGAAAPESPTQSSLVQNPTTHESRVQESTAQELAAADSAPVAPSVEAAVAAESPVPDPDDVAHSAPSETTTAEPAGLEPTSPVSEALSEPDQTLARSIDQTQEHQQAPTTEQSTPPTRPTSLMDVLSESTPSQPAPEAPMEVVSTSANAPVSGTSESNSNDQTATDELPELAPHTWHVWVEQLPLAGLPMAIARNSALIEVAGAHLVFDVDPAQSALFNDSQSARVEAAIQTLRPDTTIAMTLLPPRGETPDQRRHRLKTEALYTARQAIDSDPLVNQIINEMGASVVEDSIRPNT